MTDYYISDNSSDDSMYKWIEDHNKECKFSYLGILDRFSYDEVLDDNLCAVRVTCKCGAVKVVTICNGE